MWETVRLAVAKTESHAKARLHFPRDHDFGSILRFIEETDGLGVARMFFETILPLLQFQTSLRLQSIAAPLGADHFLSDKTPAKNPDERQGCFWVPGFDLRAWNTSRQT